MLALFAVAVLPAGLWLDVPFVPQDKNGCGAAAVSMVMEYWGRHTDPGAVARSLNPRHAGSRASELAAYLRRNGFEAYAFSAGLADLEHHLARGRPLIVCLRGGPLHFVVVAGTDPTRALVLINDPARRKLLSVPESEFVSAWHERWALLAVPKAN